MELPLRLFTVEILETAELQLVTAIEILSPVNKQPGREAYDEYLRKRRELLRSSAHLIEIDLLRAGRRPPLERPVPVSPYYVVLSREERRPTVDVWPIQLSDKLPTMPVPLLEPDPDVAMDLGDSWQPYTRAVASDANRLFATAAAAAFRCRVGMAGRRSAREKAAVIRPGVPTILSVRETVGPSATHAEAMRVPKGRPFSKAKGGAWKRPAAHFHFIGPNGPTIHPTGETVRPAARLP